MFLISWGHYFRSEENISPCIVVHFCSTCSRIQLELMLVGVGPGSNQTQSHGGSWWQLGVGPGYWLQIKHKIGWAKLIWANWIKQLKFAISAGPWLAWAWLASQAPWSPVIKHAHSKCRKPPPSPSLCLRPQLSSSPSAPSTHAYPNILQNPSSTVEPLHGEISWICNFGAVFSKSELSQTRPKALSAGKPSHHDGAHPHCPLGKKSTESKHVCFTQIRYRKKSVLHLP
jgi:hypothetical protein